MKRLRARRGGRRSATSTDGSGIVDRPRSPMSTRTGEQAIDVTVTSLHRSSTRRRPSSKVRRRTHEHRDVHRSWPVGDHPDRRDTGAHPPGDLDSYLRWCSRAGSRSRTTTWIAASAPFARLDAKTIDAIRTARRRSAPNAVSQSCGVTAFRVAPTRPRRRFRVYGSGGLHDEFAPPSGSGNWWRVRSTRSTGPPCNIDLGQHARLQRRAVLTNGSSASVPESRGRSSCGFIGLGLQHRFDEPRTGVRHRRREASRNA